MPIRIATRMIVFAALFACRPPVVVQAQISPGELSSAHAGLEGLGNCTSCHALGKAVEDRRCLDCHTELDRRIRSGRGFHATLTSQSCIQCHKEHHGRDFALVRWNEKTFDHRATGFELSGKHRDVECRKCHSQGHIKEADIARSKNVAIGRTFLGLARDCASCHNDPHGGTLGPQCLKCHDNNAWKPAPGFSHDRSRFPLTGKHQTVRCESCHGRPGGAGTTVRYTGLAFRACVDCHRDPHAGKFKQTCEGCHTTQGWEAGGKNFDHAKTRFPLRGKHASVACLRCHTPVAGVQGSRSRFAVARFSRCVDCHSDPHGRQFAPGKNREECTTCHNEQGWKPAVLPGFNHGTTRFPLRGKHATVACALCHLPQKQYPATIVSVNVISFVQCANCHSDPHRGQFSRRSDGGKCESCHQETGFTPSTYLMPAHAEARFPLDGAHAAVACDRCHTPDAATGKRIRRFRWETVPGCESCHRDVHRGQFAGVKAGGCVSCHSTEAWKATRYDHSRTAFQIDGKHRSVPCAGCHRKGEGPWRFGGTPKECAGCHTQIREG